MKILHKFADGHEVTTENDAIDSLARYESVYFDGNLPAGSTIEEVVEDVEVPEEPAKEDKPAKSKAKSSVPAQDPPAEGDKQ